MRTCTKCKLEKDDTEFHWKVKDVRRTAVCKSCYYLYQQTPYYKALAKKSQAKFYKTEHGKEKSREQCKKFRETEAFKKAVEKSRLKYPEKRSAQIALANALAAGKIKRPSVCSICKKEGKTEGHHYDYSLPLSVIWVCTMCHKHYYHRGTR